MSAAQFRITSLLSTADGLVKATLRGATFFAGSEAFPASVFKVADFAVEALEIALVLKSQPKAGYPLPAYPLPAYPLPVEPLPPEADLRAMRGTNGRNDSIRDYRA